MTRKIAILGTAAMLAGLAGTATAQDMDGTWTADLMPLNAATSGSEAGGSTAIVTISGEMVTISVDATGTPPGIMHLQHIHGFADSDETSTCPTSDADANGDGVVDLIETEGVAGTTMIPFDSDPAGLNLLDGDFPTAGDDGSYSYEQSVDLSALTDAFTGQFPDQQLDLDRRVVFVHGVPESAGVPDSAQSVGDAPAYVTLPIACGELRRTDG